MNDTELKEVLYQHRTIILDLLYDEIMMIEVENMENKYDELHKAYSGIASKIKAHNHSLLEGFRRSEKALLRR